MWKMEDNELILLLKQKSKEAFTALYVAINDLIRYSEGYSHEYLLFQSFVKYPMLTVSAFKCYWWIRTIYHKMK